MTRLFGAYGRWVGHRPWAALAAVLVVTAVAAVGLGLPAGGGGQGSFLPDGSELGAAKEKLAESFAESAQLQSVQVVLRGDVLSPGGAADARAATEAAANHPDLSGYLFEARPPTSPGHVLSAILAGPGSDPEEVDLASVAQAEVDAALAEEANAGPVSVLEELVARNLDGDVVGGIGVVTVTSGGDSEGLAGAQIGADEAVKALELGELESARTLSSGKAAKEADDSSSSSQTLLMLLAIAVIAVLLALFYRRLSDMALGLGGLMLTIVWALGFQGLLGPGGVGLIGKPSALAQMVPVMLIGLCVDYGIQFTSRYREVRAEGAEPAAGVSRSVAFVMLPLGLAGVTTIASFLTNLFGEISGLADFGVVAGVGVACGLAVFVTAVPAARVLLDRRAGARGKQPRALPIDQSIPGAGAVVEAIGGLTVKRPAAILVLAGLATLFFATTATGLGASFNSADLLPDGTETKDDVVFLTENFGGSSEPVTVLVESDLSSDRTIRNLLDFSAAIEDPLQRPEAVSSGVTLSLGTYARSLPSEMLSQIESDLALNRPHPLAIDSSVIDESLEFMRSHDPEAFDSVVALGSDGAEDRTILQFSALTGDPDRTRDLFADVDGLWFGDDEDITPVAGEITSLEITDSLIESQTSAIALTIVVAMAVLVLFFWITEFRPMLAVLAVLPIVLVLLWVLGTMVLLGFSYNVVTALITALSVGIGVDYTIHITHRFVEEHEHRAKSIPDAISSTMHTTGGALIGSALTTALGFSVLVFSPIPPMGQFGLLTAIAVVYSLIAAVVVLPPMLVTWAAYHQWRRANP